MNIYQQIDELSFHIGTSAHGPDWPGALDVEAPDYDRKTQRAKWTGEGWDIRTHEEWAEEMAGEEPDDAD